MLKRIPIHLHALFSLSLNFPEYPILSIYEHESNYEYSFIEFIDVITAIPEWLT